MGAVAEREMLSRHGTKLVDLKPGSLVEAARRDLLKRERKKPDEDGNSEVPPAEPYAFHRAHVRKATSPSDLIGRALSEIGLGQASGKRMTRLVYDDADLLRAALEAANAPS